MEFSNLLFVDECLLDYKRVKSFRDAICRVVNSSSIVVDAGTGTGIMALLAASAGAKRVYAVEKDKNIFEFAKRNVFLNGFSNVIKVVNEDIFKFKIPQSNKQADVLIMEMLDTGLIAEDQSKAIMSLRKNKVIDNKTILLPDVVASSVSLVEYDFNFYGLKFGLPIQARNFRATKHIKKVLSDDVLYSEIDLKKTHKNKVDSLIRIPVRRAGRANAIQLKTSINLLDKIVGGTSDMNMPIILPMEEVDLSNGDIVKIKLSYFMGNGFAHVLAECEKLL